MRREFGSSEKAFAREVEEFLAAHRPHPDVTPTVVDELSWRRAVVERGWSVPQWPQGAGGTGWSPTQIFIWQRACAAHGVPVEEDPGIDIVGPLLLRYATADQQARYLPEIRTYRRRWCIGFAEPGSGEDWSAMVTVATRVDAGYEIRGVKTWVRNGMDAHRMCCFAHLGPGRGYGLFVVDMAAAALRVLPLNTLDGDAGMAEVALTGAVVGDDAYMGPVAPQEFAAAMSANEYSTLSRSAVAQAQLDALDRVIQEFDPSDGIHQRRHVLAIELEGLKGLELRYLDARRRELPLPFSLSVLRLKSREILLQLGALQVESFGYYALPYPDETLLHNEGPIGPENAAATVRQNLTRQVAAIYEGSAERLKDETWRAINNEG